MNRLSSFLHEGTLTFTVTTNGYKFLTWNLWLHCRRLQVPWKLCILCLDKESYRFFQTIAMIPCIFYEGAGLRVEGNTSKVSQHGTGDFNRITRLKLKVFSDVLTRTDIQKVLYLDGDIVLFRDPWPYLHTQVTTEKPLWFQCDEHNTEYNCSGHESACHNCCTGVIALSLENSTDKQRLSALFHLEESLWKECKQNNDQEYVQKQLAKLQIPFTTFSRNLFPNGQFLHEDKWKSLQEPYLLHFNFLVGSAKERVIRAKGFWLVPY
jgi:hypothetical protein